MDKDHVAEILIEIGTLLELKGENPFKIRAYTNAARALETFTGDLPKMARENRLAEIDGIGKAIAEKITELLTNGEGPLIADGTRYRSAENGGGLPVVPVDVDGSWPAWIRERKCPPQWFRPRGPADVTR